MSRLNIGFLKFLSIVFFIVLHLGVFGQTWEKINTIDGRVFSMYQNDDIAYVCVWDDLYVGDSFEEPMTKVMDGITWRKMFDHKGRVYLGGHGQFALPNFLSLPMDSYEPTPECVNPIGPDRVSVLDLEIRDDKFYIGTIDDGVQYRNATDCEFEDISPPQLKLTADNSVLHFTEDGGLILGTFNGDLFYSGDLENWEQIGSGFGPMHDVVNFKGDYFMGSTRLRKGVEGGIDNWISVANESAGDLHIFAGSLYAARRSGLYSTEDGVSWTQHTDGLGEVDHDAILHTSGGRLYMGTRDGSIYRLQSTTSIESEELQVEVALSPNPVSTVLSVDTRDYAFNNYAIYTIRGELVQYGEHSSNNTCSISLRGLASGMYVLQLHGEKGTASKKFVVQQ